MKLSERQNAKMFEHGIPEYMHGAIRRYYENGIPPGDFLTALLNNNLKETYARADDTNVRAIKGYVMWFYNEAPAGSWGYDGAVKSWIERFQETKVQVDTV